MINQGKKMSKYELMCHIIKTVFRYEFIDNICNTNKINCFKLFNLNFKDNQARFAVRFVPAEGGP